MPFYKKNNTVYFSPFPDEDVLSGKSEECAADVYVYVFSKKILVDEGPINKMYPSYKESKYTFKTINTKSEKPVNKISSKITSQETSQASYKLQRDLEPDIYVNKKFLM